MDGEQELLQELKRDLQDGEDLSMAVSLVSDAIQRRIRRVQRSLDAMESAGSDAVRRRLRAVLDRYQAALAEQGDGLERIIEEFQPTLGALAEELDRDSDG